MLRPRPRRLYPGTPAGESITEAQSSGAERTSAPVDDEGGDVVTAALRLLRLIDHDEQPRYTRLSGGVSSDIWRVDTTRGPICVKRALPKLRVDMDWFVWNEVSCRAPRN